MRKRPPTKREHSKEKDKEQPLRHFRSQCPQLKKGLKKYKKKAMVATWSDSDESSSEEEESHEQANWCLMAHKNEVCLASQETNQKWYLDSGCSRHMTGDESQFITLDAKDGEIVTFGDNSKGKIIGIGNIGITPSKYIENILLVVV